LPSKISKLEDVLSGSASPGKMSKLEDESYPDRSSDKMPKPDVTSRRSSTLGTAFARLKRGRWSGASERVNPLNQGLHFEVEIAGSTLPVHVTLLHSDKHTIEWSEDFRTTLEKR